MAQGGDWNTKCDKPQVFGNQLDLVNGEQLRKRGDNDIFNLFLFGVCELDRRMRLFE